MVLIEGHKYACERCVRGHRVSQCMHTDQCLIRIKPKGRPTTHCTHCRETRRTNSKNVQTRCTCEQGKFGTSKGPATKASPYAAKTGSQQQSEKDENPSVIPEIIPAGDYQKIVSAIPIDMGSEPPVWPVSRNNTQDMPLNRDSKPLNVSRQHGPLDTNNTLFPRSTWHDSYYGSEQHYYETPGARVPDRRKSSRTSTSSTSSSSMSLIASGYPEDITGIYDEPLLSPIEEPALRQPLYDAPGIFDFKPSAACDMLDEPISYAVRPVPEYNTEELVRAIGDIKNQLRQGSKLNYLY